MAGNQLEDKISSSSLNTEAEFTLDDIPEVNTMQGRKLAEELMVSRQLLVYSCSGRMPIPYANPAKWT